MIFRKNNLSEKLLESSEKNEANVVSIFENKIYDQNKNVSNFEILNSKQQLIESMKNKSLSSINQKIQKTQKIQNKNHENQMISINQKIRK